MTKRAKGFIKTVDKPGRKAVVASNMNAFEMGVKGVLAILAAARVLLLGVQAIQGTLSGLPNKRRLMADIKKRPRVK